ncbi:unnamed protein product, partial [Hapterophycus canaliculatus]
MSGAARSGNACRSSVEDAYPPFVRDRVAWREETWGDSTVRDSTVKGVCVVCKLQVFPPVCSTPRWYMLRMNHHVLIGRQWTMGVYNGMPCPCQSSDSMLWRQGSCTGSCLP